MVGTWRRDRQIDECIILASVWACNSRFQWHLNGPKTPETSTLRSNNQWKPRQISSRMSMCTVGCCKKNWPECWKSCAITHENGPKQTFSRKRTCKPLGLGDITLVLLCIKLWLVRWGGTVRVTKCIILASVWARNSRFQRHLNGPQKAQNMYPTV
jgi:hypothetical protein